MFDFFAHKEVFFDKVIKLTVRRFTAISFKFVLPGVVVLDQFQALCVFYSLQVMHSKMLRSFVVGSFKLDVWTVYKQPGELTQCCSEPALCILSVAILFFWSRVTMFLREGGAEQTLCFMDCLTLNGTIIY